MKTHLLLILSAACIFPSTSSAQTAEEIIARNIAARGGAERFRAIHSMVVRTHEEANWGGTGTSTLRVMRPDRMRFDYSWQANPKAEGFTSTLGFDGQTGWQIAFIKGKRKMVTIPAEALDLLREGAQNTFEEPLIDPKATSNKVELLGTETVEGKQCYKVRFTSRTGQIRYAYYDAESFLEVRNDQVVDTKKGKEKLLTTMISDYRSVSGILFPHTFTSIAFLTCPFASVRGIPLPMAFSAIKRDRSISTIEGIEINPAMDESTFQMPATSAVIPHLFPDSDTLAIVLV